MHGITIFAMSLGEIDEKNTEYTDRVTIKAGWKTFFVWLWANAFYAHRQRRWKKLISESETIA